MGRGLALRGGLARGRYGARRSQEKRRGLALRGGPGTGGYGAPRSQEKPGHFLEMALRSQEKPMRSRDKAPQFLDGYDEKGNLR
jgi:hypothetical protein